MQGSLLLVELGIVLLGLGLLGALAARFAISPIPFYLLAGLAFGSGGFWPLTASERFIETGAELGVILLLFTLGLEYSAADLVTSLRSTAVPGLFDLVLNAAPGVAAAFWLGWGPVAALALGGITCVTSSGISAKILGDLGWLGHRETAAVLSLLVFEDLAMATYLPILTAVLAGAGLIGGLGTLAAALATVTVILFVALRHGARVERFVASPDREVLLLKVLGLTLLVAGIAERLQVSAAVGAFLVGIALSGPLAHTARNLVVPLRDLFAAVFFVFFGLRTDPSDLPAVAGAATLLAFGGTVTKLATGWFAAARAGNAVSGRLRAGTVRVPRGEFSIVIAGLAVAAGARPALGSLAAAYVLVLVVAAPLLARAAGPFGRRLAARGASTAPPDRPPATGPAADEPATETPPTDGPPTDETSPQGR